MHVYWGSGCMRETTKHNDIQVRNMLRARWVVQQCTPLREQTLSMSENLSVVDILNLSGTTWAQVSKTKANILCFKMDITHIVLVLDHKMQHNTFPYVIWFYHFDRRAGGESSKQKGKLCNLFRSSLLFFLRGEG